MSTITGKSTTTALIQKKKESYNQSWRNKNALKRKKCTKNKKKIAIHTKNIKTRKND